MTKDCIRFCATAVVICSFIFSSSGSMAEQKVQTSIVYYLDRTMSEPESGAIIALKKGYFESEGLNVKIVEGAIDRRPTASISEDAIEIGIASVFDFLRAREAGRSLVAFASAYARSPIAFFVRRDSRIQSIADFVDRTVAYEPRDSTAIIFDALLAKNNISKSTIKTVAGRQSVSALASHAIDILPGYVGRESHLLNQIGVSFDQINPDSFGLHLPGSVYLTGEDALRSDPEIVQRFLRALVRGWNTVYRKDSEDLNTIAEAFGLPDAAAASRLLDEQRPLLRPSGRRFAELDPIDIRDALAVLVKQRLISNTFRLINAVDLEILKNLFRSEQKGILAD